MSTNPGPEAGRDRGLARRDPSGSRGGASAHRSAGPALVVMTRNVYVGAEIEAVLGASDPEQVPLRVAEAFAAVRATDFAERAHALAAEIEAAGPHLVGLQEVSLIRIEEAGDFAPGRHRSARGHPAAAPAEPAAAPGPREYPRPKAGLRRPRETAAVDHLDLLLDALAARRLDYDVAARVDNFDLEVPMRAATGLRTVRLTDSDVILARSDVSTTAGGGGGFAAARQVSLGERALEVRRGWTAVDATVAGRTCRFVNTHLEPADVDDGAVVPELESLQRAQAAELLATLEEVDHPVVLVGDLNSAADGSSTGAYRMMLDAGFVDAWTLGGTGAGFTSNQAADLRNPESRLFHRIDFVLYRDADTRAGGDFPGTVRAELVGGNPADRTPSGLWPSDHAGVVAFLSFGGE